MGMHRGNLFIARENMTSAYDLESVSNLSDIAYYHFMNYEDEVLYLLYEGKLLGVLSIGDLERFFDSSEKELKINQKYASISAVNYDAAERFFGNSITINEIPIVTECGFFVGIIRKEKTKALRDQQRRELEAAKKGEGMWRRGEMWRFVNETKASVFLYTYSDKKVMKQLEYEDKQKIKKHRRKMEEESIWEVLTKQEWDTFLHGEKDEGVDTLRKERDSCIPAFINGKAIFPDVSGNYYTIQRGHRFTPNNPLYADRKIIMFGPCNVFGAFCKDDQTIEAYLQDSLNANGYISWRVLNKGVCGVDICYDQLFVEKLSEDDIVVIIGIEKWVPDEIEHAIAFRGDLSGIFVKLPHLSDYVLDSISHFNYVVNKELAQQIYKDICLTGLLEKPKRPGVPEKIQDYYINWSIREYFMEYFQKYGLIKESANIKVGAIVMNCNPFTKGHRYLIEQASEIVDRLYIFVVEEDRSLFKFRDRFRMVEQGVSDLHGVHVVPSGRYIISLDTFKQYFEKEQVKTVNSMDYDVYIFGEVVAEALGIKYRFVGEEPFDKVTRAYNETMKRILPKFGVNVIEFPRALSKEKEIISATLVRKAMQEENMSRIEKLCPESTVLYLKEQLNWSEG